MNSFERKGQQRRSLEKNRKWEWQIVDNGEKSHLLFTGRRARELAIIYLSTLYN